jgi:hypothetical protein
MDRSSIGQKLRCVTTGLVHEVVDVASNAYGSFNKIFLKKEDGEIVTKSHFAIPQYYEKVEAK